MKLKTGSQMAVRERTGVSLIELCEAGRYREAQTLAEEMEAGDSQSVLAFGMIEYFRGNLEKAKNHLTPLAFSSDELAGRAKIYLAHAYYFGGEANEAKSLLDEAPDSFIKLLLKAIMEPRPTFALRVLEKASRFEVRPGMQARLHNQRALILRKIGKLDRAVQEYEAALYFFEQDRSDCLPLVLNNVAGVYLDYGETDRAHKYADRAISLLSDDLPHLGKALDQKAQILLAQGNSAQARIKSEQAIAVLKQSDRKEWLIEALLTYARILRDQKDEREFDVLREAAQVCAYLHRDDLLIDVLQRRLEMSKIVAVQDEKRLIETSLSVCGGKYRAVAARLKTTHQRVMRLVKKHGLHTKN